MNLIAAVSADWGIGKDGRLLCSIPEDMKFFRRTTLNSMVIMGRRTLESFPGGRPLPRRTNVVLTRDPLFACEGVLPVHSVEEALQKAKDAGSEPVFIIGGESVYRLFLPYCETAYITKMDITLPADAWFPNLDETEGWEMTGCGPVQEYEKTHFQFVTYQNRQCRAF